MKLFFSLAATLLLATAIHAASVDETVAAAVLPLPQDLRAAATVVQYDPATGERKVLRQGTNQVECEPENPADGFTRCYGKMAVPSRMMEAKLKAEKKPDAEIRKTIEAAIKDGTIKGPAFGTMHYRLSQKDGVIKRLWTMSVPYATPESIGVSTVSQRDAALKGKGIPWMMLEGTAGAHIMIPINE